MTCEGERTRLVVLGGPRVGKSAIVNKFLYNTYTDKYRTTVEDLHSRTFQLGQISLKVDILDTCGDLQFPAMRRLSIATAHAFLLVYSVTSEESFFNVQRCFEEVREQRPDFQEVPIVLAGNKLDLAETSSSRKVALEDASEWLYCTLPKLRTKLMECSAKTGANIQEVFKTFVTLAKLLPNTTDDTTPLKRRSSAYGSRRGGSPASTSSSPSGSLATSSPKPRSRSLIRRSSRKTKQHLSDSNPDAPDCIIS